MSKKKTTKNNAICRGRAITQTQKEMMIQAYAISGNKSEVARNMGCSFTTVCKVIKEAELDKGLQIARTRALDQVAGMIHGKTVEIIDSITPEDLESGTIKKYDDKGNLASVKAYGPSLLQKVTSAAILTDKIQVVEQTKKALLEDDASGDTKLMLPNEMQSAIRMLGSKIKRLRMIDVQFDTKHEETVSKVQEVAHAASLHEEVEEADYADLFDNPEDK